LKPTRGYCRLPRAGTIVHPQSLAVRLRHLAAASISPGTNAAGRIAAALLSAVQSLPKAGASGCTAPLLSLGRSRRSPCELKRSAADRSLRLCARLMPLPLYVSTCSPCERLDMGYDPHGVRTAQGYVEVSSSRCAICIPDPQRLQSVRRKKDSSSSLLTTSTVYCDHHQDSEGTHVYMYTRTDRSRCCQMQHIRANAFQCPPRAHIPKRFRGSNARTRQPSEPRGEQVKYSIGWDQRQHGRFQCLQPWHSCRTLNHQRRALCTTTTHMIQGQRMAPASRRIQRERQLEKSCIGQGQRPTGTAQHGRAQAAAATNLAAAALGGIGHTARMQQREVQRRHAEYQRNTGVAHTTGRENDGVTAEG